MTDSKLQEFLKQDLLPRNDLLTFRLNRKLATFVRGHASLSKSDPSTVVRYAVQKWAESEGYNQCGL